jgi:hypothetical protein
MKSEELLARPATASQFPMSRDTIIRASLMHRFLRLLLGVQTVFGRLRPGLSRLETYVRNLDSRSLANGFNGDAGKRRPSPAT